jgi:hypothetical protein
LTFEKDSKYKFKEGIDFISVSIFLENGGRTSEYGKFTVEGLVGIYDTFKKPAELNK